MYILYLKEKYYRDEHSNYGLGEDEEQKLRKMLANGVSSRSDCEQCLFVKLARIRF